MENSRNTSTRKQIDELKRSMSLEPQEINMKALLPIFVPASFFEGENWFGPFCLLRAHGLATTWAILLPEQTMLYLSQRIADYWDRMEIDWRNEAMENLVRLSEDLCTGTFQRENGEVYALVMMHEDGCGPSRLLLNSWIEEIFPIGYRIAIPERSVGIAVSTELSNVEQEKVQNVVRKCFEDGTRPLSPHFYDPDDLVIK